MLACLALLAAVVATARADSTVVFNELHYHPATNEPASEWVELHNQMAVDMELSGWRLAGGIEFSFPEGTIVPGGGYLVVALSPTELVAATGLTNVLGPFTGRLSNNGEKLELRNNNDRLMDALDYGVEGDWPVAPDGAGPSLAKCDEDTASADPANWRASWQPGGTPGQRNFPDAGISVTSTNLAPFDAVWRYEDSGTDLGTVWREAAFDDSAWATGAGLFHVGLGSWAPGQTEPIAGLFNTGLDTNGTALVPGFADPHYVLTASAYSTPPPPPIAATTVANHPNWLANDAASVWIGPISQGTTSVPQGGYTYRTTFNLTGYDPTTAQVTLQVAVDNDLTSLLLNGTSLGFTYSGFSAWSLPVTRNTGFVAGTNTLDLVTSNAGSSASPAGLRVLLTGTALKRLPTNTVLVAGSATRYFRKTFRFTGDPAAAALQVRPVVDDGAVFYLNGAEVLRLNLPGGVISHGTAAVTNVGNANLTGPFNLPTGSLVSGSNVLAVELHQAAGGASDALFGAALTLTLTHYPVAPPPPLAFNELPAVTNGQFWVEIVNHGEQSVTLANAVLARFGTFYREYPIPSQTLAPGAFLVLDKATVGFGADPGDRVVLYAAGRASVLDAVVAKSFPRARWPDGTGAWLHPSEPSPGATNRFALHDEIVINEILYHPRDLPATPAQYFTNLLLTITNDWRYDQSGADLGAAWLAPDYDDSLWPVGQAVFYTNITTLPAPKGTTLALSNAAGQAITTYYFRAPFLLTNSPEGIQLSLNPILDDGAVFYLNGVEVYRYGMSAGPITHLTRANTNIGVPLFSGPVTIPTDSLVAGVNVLAVEVHQYLPPPGSRDVAFGVELLGTGFINPALPARESPESWVELHNRSTNAVDLAGWRLDDGITFPFPTGTTIAPGGYLVVAKDVAGMQARHPGLTVLGPFTNRLARGGESIVLKDAAGNPADQVRYFDSAPWPGVADGLGSSLELRDPRADNSRPEVWAASDESGKSSWQTYTYRGVATAEPAASPTIWNEFVLGLLGEGEVLLDDISVLESPGTLNRQLIQNGSFETGLTAWRILGNHRRSQVIVDPTNAGNRVLRLVAGGETEHMHNHAETTLASGATIVNGTQYQISFRAKWLSGCQKLNTRLYFNRLARTTLLAVPDLAGTPGARNSTYATNVGPTFTGLSHVPVVPTSSQPVTISVNASDPDGVTNATLFYAVNSGAWQTVTMSARSLFRAQLSDEGESQSAPLLTPGLSPLRGAGDAVGAHRSLADHLRAPAFSLDGLGGSNAASEAIETKTHRRAPSPLNEERAGVRGENLRKATTVQAAQISADSPTSTSGIEPLTFVMDAPQTLSFTASIPAQPAGAIVQFYVAAQDGLGVTATYPAGGTNSRACYEVNNSQPPYPRLHTVRLVMPPADAEFLHAPTNVMSNERLGCTVIYDERETFYNAGVHLQASERGRNVSSRVGFTFRVPAEQLFRGVHQTVTLDRSGGYSGRGGRQDEILLKHAVNRAGGLPGMYDDLVQVFAPRPAEDSTALLIMAKYRDVFLDSQFENGGDGEMYKLELVYYPTSTVTGDPQSLKLPQPDLVLGTDIKDLGDDPEAYRWTFLKENHVARDNYAPMIALAKAFSLTGTNLDARTRELVDVDEWMRAVALLGLIGGADMYTFGNSHNLIIYFRPEDGRGMAFPWDLDYSFVQPINQAIPGSGSANTYKLITTLPDNYRRYYYHLLDLSNVTGDAAYMGRWAAHYAGLVGQNWSGVVDYLSQRAAYVRSTMPLTTPFAITNNGGNNLSVTNDRLVLGGTAPLTVKDIEVNGIRYPVTWTSLTTWTLTVLLPGHTNLLVVQGTDSRGANLTNALDTITVTNLGRVPPLPVVINEWMADNRGPGGLADPADGLFQDWFELFNPNTNVVALAGLYLTDNLGEPTKWPIPTNIFIGPRGFLLVWADNNPNQNPMAGGTNVDLHANFALNNGGEAIGLFAADGVTPLSTVVFGAQLQNVSQGLFPDGSTNAVYWMTNWSPRASNRLGAPPPPTFEPLVVSDGNRVTLSFSATPNRTYAVEFKEDLSAPIWALLTIRTATGPFISVGDDMAGRAQRFYRVVLWP